MSVLTSFQGAIGGTTTLYRVLRRDYARRRRWNKTTSTWKSTVSSGDAQETLTEQATPHKGIYEVTTSGMGAPGLIHTYFKNIASGRIVGARRVTISDGAYLNNPDAAVTTDADKLRLDLWTTVPAAGEPITPDLISSIQYSLYRRSDSDLALNTHIDGHYLKALTVNDVVLSSLQNDYLWDEAVDEGYNFRHQFDIQEYVLLSERGARYDAQFMFTPASGQKFPARFKMYTDG